MSLKRSGDVTAAAIVLLFGSGLMILFGGGDGLYMLSSHTDANWPRLLFVLGLPAVLGIATGIGILKLRPWARISIVVISAVAIFFCFVMAAALALVTLGGSLRGTSGSSSLLLLVDVGLFAIPASVAVWWFVLFTRRRVSAEFSAPQLSGDPVVNERRSAPAAASGFSTSITVIALWFFLGAFVDFQAALFRSFSTIVITVLGIHLRRYAAVCVFIVMMQLNTVVGIGLLRRARWARIGGIVLCIYGVLNRTVTFLVPGSSTRFAVWASSSIGREFVSSAIGLRYMHVLHGLLFAGGLLASIVALYFLVTRRRAFREACAE